MCRWLAYVGAALPLGDLLTRPDHSLIDQSRRARENVETTNGDGFGVGWYGSNQDPATFHDTHPAWNNTNLNHLADHVRSRLFLSHVRASSGTPIQETNCFNRDMADMLVGHVTATIGYFAARPVSFRRSRRLVDLAAL